MAVPSSKLLFHINNKQHGAGTVVIAWQAAGNYVATAGSNRQVHIYDRYGQVVDDIGVTAGGAIMAMDWDSEGETLAVMQQSNSALIFWDAATRKTNMVETNMKDLSWFKWNANGPELAVGTVKANPPDPIHPISTPPEPTEGKGGPLGTRAAGRKIVNTMLSCQPSLSPPSSHLSHLSPRCVEQSTCTRDSSPPGVLLATPAPPSLVHDSLPPN